MNAKQTKLPRRALLKPLGALAMGVGAVILGLPAPAGAQDKPAVRILVGFPPGGSVDVIARVIGEAMRDDFNTVVENKPGAAGRIALGQLKAAKPDGLTLAIAPSPGFVLFPHLYKKLDYDATRDFTPICELAIQPFAVTTGAASGVKTIQELADKARSNPGSATFGSSGEGSAGHILGAWLEQLLNVKLSHVPFQGGAPATVAMLGGHVAYKIDALSETTELHRTGKARILAVTGPRRDPQVPDVPTLKELGVNMEITAWFALYGPAGIPKDMVDRLSQSAIRAVKRPEVAEKLAKLGFQTVGSTPAELAAQQRIDFDAWGKPVKALGLSLD